VAVTNADGHLAGVREIAGDVAWTRTFTRENGAAMIRKHFAQIERRDADGWITIDDDATVRAFVVSLGQGMPDELPPYDLPLRARRATSVFVATKAE